MTQPFLQFQQTRFPKKRGGTTFVIVLFVAFWCQAGSIDTKSSTPCTSLAPRQLLGARLRLPDPAELGRRFWAVAEGGKPNVGSRAFLVRLKVPASVHECPTFLGLGSRSECMIDGYRFCTLLLLTR